MLVVDVLTLLLLVSLYCCCWWFRFAAIVGVAPCVSLTRFKVSVFLSLHVLLDYFISFAIYLRDLRSFLKRF